MNAQLSFDFDAAIAAAVILRAKHPMEAETREANIARRLASDAEAIKYWRVGAVTSLPMMCDIDGGSCVYTYTLPGVIEAIDGALAVVRIYAAPEYGYRLENYPLHLALAVNVPLRDLGRYGLSSRLGRIVGAGLLATGDAELAAEVRGRHSLTPGVA